MTEPKLPGAPGPCRAEFRLPPDAAHLARVRRGVSAGPFSRRSGVRYLPDLVDRALTGAIAPGKVFDLTLPLDQVAEG